MVLLHSIQTPCDLRALTAEQLPALAQELRAFLLQSLNQTGGHFAANLGTVELSIALHYVFNTPEDALIWDVGHQAYPHKILTGRRDRFGTLRQHEGLAPFPDRSESHFDAFGVGHSSTSISAALGMILAWQQQERKHRACAVIGDGAMTAGMAFEALNHAGGLDLQLPFLVVLNDNDMSISHNVGALSNYLARILSSKTYSAMRAGSKRFLADAPKMRHFMRRTETHLKGMIMPGTLFEELGFHYIGPIDGHDLPLLVQTLERLKDQPAPILLHVITQKGKGYPPAEHDPIRYHAVSPGFLEADQKKAASKTPAPSTALPKAPSFSQVFGQWLCATAAQDPLLHAITPAMSEGSGMVAFHERFPDQYSDVGIAEQHAVTLAAGMACAGLRPVVALYASFLQRAYDQVVHDVVLQNLPVVFALDRAGLVPDGPTHSGLFDVAMLRTLPNMSVLTPSGAEETWQALTTAYERKAPVAVRYPRGQAQKTHAAYPTTSWAWGRGHVRRMVQATSEQPLPPAVFLVWGPLLHTALDCASELNASVCDMRFAKPLDETLVLSMARQHALVITLEEHALAAGVGEAVAHLLLQNHVTTPLVTLGVPDVFIPHGNMDSMLRAAQLDKDSILSKIRLFQKQHRRQRADLTS